MKFSCIVTTLLIYGLTTLVGDFNITQPTNVVNIKFLTIAKKLTKQSTEPVINYKRLKKVKKNKGKGTSENG